MLVTAYIEARYTEMEYSETSARKALNFLEKFKERIKMHYSVIDLQRKIIEIYEKFRRNYLEYAKKMKEFAKELYGDKFLSLAVFGSTVKGNYKPWSDVDIAIVLKEKINEFERIKILKKIREEFGEINPFEIHFFTREEWEKYRKLVGKHIKV